MNRKGIDVTVTCVITITIVFGFWLSVHKQTQSNIQTQKFSLQNVTNEINIENYSSVRVVNEKWQWVIFQNDTIFFKNHICSYCRQSSIRHATRSRIFWSVSKNYV